MRMIQYGDVAGSVIIRDEAGCCPIESAATVPPGQLMYASAILKLTESDRIGIMTAADSLFDANRELLVAALKRHKKWPGTA